MAPPLSKREGGRVGLIIAEEGSLMEIGGQSAGAGHLWVGTLGGSGMKAGTPPRGCQRKRGWCQGKWRKWQVPCRPLRCTDRAGTTGRGQATTRGPGIGSRGENRARSSDGGKEGIAGMLLLVGAELLPKYFSWLQIVAFMLCPTAAS